MLCVDGRKIARFCGRSLAILTSLAVSAALIYAQSSHDAEPKPTETAAAAPPAPSNPAQPPAGGMRIANPAEAAALAASVPMPTEGQQFTFPLPPGVAPENGLQVKTIWAARTIGVLFQEVKNIYGYRQDPLKWHPDGLAIDVMIPDYHSEAGILLGDQIAGYALANAQRWGVNHVIWRQKIYPGVGGGNWTSDYGNETANHYDHVHIATDGGGYPTGQETYYISSMTPAHTD
ncbi:glycoside hydrolase [[Mycobacterium] holstebronense]|uniref:Glycoside hydrolase n=1 Tax=[Mycobacterium] holstebronense TaxID=3064288 RepID=A0ABM9LQY5_9MYCO|nr:glycoside hydrolase [Mycolicibacter sp. MU0102]CAJ1503247.1 glycoside hydrolase [Mycolicibacter sp. MU0102]